MYSKPNLTYTLTVTSFTFKPLLPEEVSFLEVFQCFNEEQEVKLNREQKPPHPTVHHHKSPSKEQAKSCLKV